LTGWKAANHEIDRQDENFKREGRLDHTPNPLRERTKRFNSIAVWTFTLATVLLFGFAALNLGDVDATAALFATSET